MDSPESLPLHNQQKHSPSDNPDRQDHTPARHEVKRHRLAVETVPGLPGLTRKQLFYKPFVVYEDTIDLHMKENGKRITDVPALFTILDSADTDEGPVLIGNEFGKPLGYVDMRTIEESYEWSLPLILMPAKNARPMEVYEKPPSKYPKKPGKLINSKPGMKFPVLETTVVSSITWYKIGPPLNSGNNLILQEPVWTDGYTHQKFQETANLLLAVPEITARRYISKMTRLLDELDLLKSRPEERGDASETILGLRTAYLMLWQMEIHESDKADNAVKQLEKMGMLMGNIATIGIVDVAEMDNAEFTLWIRGLTSVVNSIKQQMNSSDNPFEMHMHGEKTKLFPFRKYY